MTKIQRFLTIYSATVTMLLVVTVFSGFVRTERKAKFDEIDVQRINLIEPDGTLRLVLSDQHNFPGLIIQRKEYPHPNRKTAGILFFDDEGTENGGLVFGGAKGKDGKIKTWGHLSFDQYMQDQVFTIDASEEDGRRTSYVQVWDRPNFPMTELLDEQHRIAGLSQEEQRTAIHRFFEPPDHQAHSRLSLGRSADRSVALRLQDTEGRDRILLQVTADGSPVLKFLDESGRAIIQLPPAERE